MQSFRRMRLIEEGLVTGDMKWNARILVGAPHYHPWVTGRTDMIVSRFDARQRHPHKLDCHCYDREAIA